MSESEILERLDLDMGVRKGLGLPPLSLICYKNCTTCAKEIN